jgi:hypothetical protein
MEERDFLHIPFDARFSIVPVGLDETMKRRDLWRRGRREGSEETIIAVHISAMDQTSLHSLIGNRCGK